MPNGDRSKVIINGLSSVGEVTINNATRTITVTISEENLASILDTWETDTIDFAVTALLFESDYQFWGVENAYTVVEGNDTVTGTFGGQYMSVSMPQNSKFVTIAIPNVEQTATQKITAEYFDVETEQMRTVEYDLDINIVV